jgi:hypothetical protein
MSKDARSLLALTLGCTFAATLFGFGSIMFSLQSAYEAQGREQLLFFAREFVYVTLAIILVMKGGWWGVLAAITMTIGATTLEWLLPGSAAHVQRQPQRPSGRMTSISSSSSTSIRKTSPFALKS